MRSERIGTTYSPDRIDNDSPGKYDLKNCVFYNEMECSCAIMILGIICKTKFINLSTITYFKEIL